MKKLWKLFVLFVSAIMASNTFSFASFAEEKTVALIESTFETGTFENWSAFGGRSKVDITKEKSHSGEYSLLSTEREISWSGPTLSIKDIITNGSELRFSAYVLAEDPEGAAVQMTVKTIGSNGAENFTAVATGDASDSEWLLLEGVYEPSGDIAEASLYIETLTGISGFYLDDVTVSGGEKPESNNDVNDGNYSFSFEDTLDGWIPRGPMSLEISNQFSYKGKCSIYASDRIQVWNAPMVRISKVVPGVDYFYSAYVMYNGKEYEDSHIFQLKLQYIQNGVETYTTIADKVLQKGTWSNLSGHYVIPDGVSDVYLYIQTNDVNPVDEEVTMNDLLSFYVDNVTIEDSTATNAKKSAAMMLAAVIGFFALGFVILISVLLFRKTSNRKAALRSACMDAMTNTYNRNTFEEKMKALEGAQEKTKKVYISVCDVNFLKYINDNYGHENGDKAIIRCAAALLRSVGKKGNVYRTGGDEFVCICEKDMTDEIKTELSIETGKYKGYPFAVAVGTASYDKELDGNSPDIKAIFARADKEMYKNKQEIKKNNKDFTG